MKKRWKRTAAVILALSMLAAPPGIPAGALAESRESIDGIRGSIEESAKEGYAFAESPTEFSAEPSLEETGTADSRNPAEMELQADGISMQMETAEVNYQKADWNGSTVIYSGQTAADCIRVESSTEAVIWNAGWYAVSGEITISEPVTVNGDVSLILTDGCALNAEKGIVVTDGNSLTIYAQSGGSGRLTATGMTDSGNNASAGIGGSTELLDSGSITIHGGVIHATGGVANDGFGNPNLGSAGIGGGSSSSANGGNSGAIMIYGGTITADSGNGYITGAGIGGGGSGSADGGSGNDINICSGSVTATSHAVDVGGAGIGGGGCKKNGGTGGSSEKPVAIYGGTVHATGSECGAGIGGGSGSSGSKSGNGNVTIYGGKVTAVGGDTAAGIGGGGGYQSQYMSPITGGIGDVSITGGFVDAKGGEGSSGGAPIGNGGNQSTAAAVSKDNAIVFENGTGTVCGSVTFDGSYNIPADYSLNIPAGASLSGNGTLTGGGTFTAELSENMISVPADLYYNGTDRAAELQSGLSAGLDKGITLCGQTFTVSGWTVAVTQTDDLTYTATYTNENDSTKTITITITLLQSGTALDGAVQTYNGGTQTAQFTASDTITVKATPAATGKAPAGSAVFTARFAEPAAGQMAVFVNDTQVSAPADADADGSYTMTVSAADVLRAGQAGQENKYTLIVRFVEDTNMADADAQVEVTVTPNPLAVDMVKLSVESVTYNGTEQKPTVTVTGLTDGTDYEVTFQDGFMNAGTYTVTITGKGIYAGTVEKTFTIEKATPTVAWKSSNVELTYTGQPADIELTVTLVNSETFSGTITYTYEVYSGPVRPTDAASYTVKASIPEQDNYTAAESGWLILYINPADQAAPAAPAATEENIKDNSITLTAVENAEYSRDGTNWQDSPVFTGLEANTAYTFFVRLKADRNHNASPGSAASITTRKPALDGATVTVSGSYTYNGTAVVPAPANVAVILNGETIDSSQYTISAASNIHAGTAAVTVTAAADGDYSGSASAAFTIGKAALTVRAGGQTITYGEGIAQGTGQVTADGLCGSDSLDSITLTASSGQVAAENKTVMPSSARIQNADGEDVTASYDITYETGTLTINRAQGLLTVPGTSFNKKFGDAAFSLNCSTNGDGRISYASSDEGVVSVSADGTARIAGAGTAAVTVSLAEGANYTGGREEKITVTADKADAPDAGQETRNYTYASGSRGAVTIDVAGKLPADRGKTDYTVTKADEKGILSGDVSVDVDGKLTFTVSGGQSEGDTASIRVTAVMANYGDAEYTVEIKLVEKIAVNFTLTEQPQDGIYDGKPHNGYTGLAAQTVNGSYTGTVQFRYMGTGETSYDSAAPPVRAGSYTVTASVPEDNTEYAGSSEAVSFTIRRAAITIRAENRTAQAGSPLPELTYTVSGLAENEQLAAAPQLSCSADMNKAGVYPITAGGAKAPDADNYEEEITYEDGTLTVLDSAVHVTGISLDKTTLSLSIGSTGRLTAALSPENATDRSVSWASDNPSAASVDNSGNITAVHAGTAVITVADHLF